MRKTRYIDEELWKPPAASYRKSKLPFSWLKRLKNYQRYFIVFLMFIVVFMIFQSTHPFAGYAQESIRYWLAVDYNFEPMIDNLLAYGLWADNFDQAVFKTMAGNQDKVGGGSLPREGTAASSQPVFPLSGKIIRPFGWILSGDNYQQDYHEGIDIAAPLGTPVRAVLAGSVIKVTENKILGKIVEIEHAGGIKTLYAHCSEVLVKAGQEVAAGQTVARVGQSGVADAAQLHFEVRVNGQLVDPLPLLHMGQGEKEKGQDV